MQALAGVSFLLLVCSAWWVAIRLLTLARRTRRLPETVLGAMMLSLMGLGYPLAVAAQAEGALGLDGAKLMQAVSSGLIDTGFLLMLVFNWRVFRPSRRWARGMCLTGGVALTLHWFGAVSAIRDLDSMKGAVEATTSWALVALSVGFVASIWTAVEALRYRGLLERRIAMGLADPVLSNRFLLWGSMGVATALGAAANATFLVARIDVLASPMAQLVTSLAGLAQAGLLTLTFTPPAAYTRWLEGREVGQSAPVD